MTKEELMSKRKTLLDMLDAYKKTINVNWTEAAEEFIKATTEVKIGSVYEIKETSTSRRKYKRIAVYAMEVKIYMEKPFIRVGGWWLNKKNIPEKWDTLVIWGVANPSELELSSNQAQEPYPEGTNKVIHGEQ